MKRVRVFLLAAWLACPTMAQATGPATLYEWFEQQHQLMRRYRTVLRQAVHDLSYEYQTPALMLPIAMDFYTGEVAHMHELERRVLYPAVKAQMTPEQQRQLDFLDQEIDSEHAMVQKWQRSSDKAGLIDAVDYLEQMLNRHLVLQEQWVFPVLDKLSAKQAALLRDLARMDAALFGRDGRRGHEAALAHLEGEIARISPRL